MNEEALKQIAEINVNVREALENYSNIMLTADADNWAYYLNYEVRDILNVALIFQHVITNVGIKNGHVTNENAAEFGKRIRQLIIDMTGYDTASISNEGKEEEKQQCTEQ